MCNPLDEHSRGGSVPPGPAATTAYYMYTKHQLKAKPKKLKPKKRPKPKPKKKIEPVESEEDTSDEERDDDFPTQS